MSKSVSPAKVAANQRNAQKSTGPKDTTSTRFNAATHGLLAQGITELDDADGYLASLQRLNECCCPVGILEAFQVERIALCMVRLRRAPRLEAEFIRSAIHPPVYGPDLMADPFASMSSTVVDVGLPASIESNSVDLLANTFQRYEAAIENRLYRAIHELERLQRIRRGEQLPAPAVVDVAVHTDTSSVGSFGNSPGK